MPDKISIAKQIIVHSCDFCGKEFELSYNQKYAKLKTNKKDFYCSKQCKSAVISSMFTKKRPILKCCICGKEFTPSDDQFTKYNKNPDDSFFCSRSCVMRKSLTKINIASRNATMENRYTDAEWVAKRTYKTKLTNIHKYGIDSQFKREFIKEKAKQTKIRKYSDPNFNNRVKAALTFSQNFPNNASSTSKVSKINLQFNEFIQGDEMETPLENYNYDIRKGNTLIEIDPSFTHNCLSNKLKGVYGGKEKDYHYKKTLAANRNGYRCIHVFDWDDWEKIKYLLISKETLYARKLQIKEVSRIECDEFLNTYHLQNTCKNQTIRLGLYKNDTLIELMTFGKPRYNRKYEYELLRLCTHKDYKVVGGAERLFKHFINIYIPTSIISYCDISKFTGDVYTRLGFKKSSIPAIGKHWSKGNKQITDNLLRQRGYDQLFNTNYGKGISNEELMLQNNWLPIFDCGQVTYTYNKKEEVK